MKKPGRSGQVLVEMVLILPVFLAMVFSVMEIGLLSFQMILLNHATYECARIGAMTFTAPYAETRAGGDCGKLGDVMRQILDDAKVACDVEPTVEDPQVTKALGSTYTNQDLIVTGTRDVPLIFPFAAIWLDNTGSGKRRIQAVVRMPIETPIPR